MKSTAVAGKPMTKTQIVEELMGATGLQRKDVNAVLDNLGTLVERHVKKRSVGKFVLPGLLQIKTVKKPARKAQKNVPNPFRPGENYGCCCQACLYGCQSTAAQEAQGYG